MYLRRWLLPNPADAASHRRSRNWVWPLKCTGLDSVFSLRQETMRTLPWLVDPQRPCRPWGPHGARHCGLQMNRPRAFSWRKQSETIIARYRPVRPKLPILIISTVKLACGSAGFSMLAGSTAMAWVCGHKMSDSAHQGLAAVRATHKDTMTRSNLFTIFLKCTNIASQYNSYSSLIGFEVVGAIFAHSCAKLANSLRSECAAEF